MKKIFLFFALPIVALLSFVSCGDDEDEKNSSDNELVSESGKERGHSYVDLGLSVRWATCNLGASKITEYGEYFAWGETASKSVYSWSTYQLGNSQDAPSKYNEKDGKSLLESEDDAATVNWGGAWRIPTIEELDELISGCDWEWVDDLGGKGVAGRLGVSKKNGKTIFLPAAGASEAEDGSEPRPKGSAGFYWSSSSVTYGLANSYALRFSRGCKVLNDDLSRFYGFSVRAVCPSAK